MQIRLASNLQTDSIVDGEGLRTVIWTQGCPHHCPFCHNPETHDVQGGFSVEISEILKQIDHLENQAGITFSGGDPMMQPEACSYIAAYAKELGLNIWCYTGFTFEKLLELSKTNNYIMDFLKQIDYLIDGPFLIKQKSLDCLFRGSTNQRILDVKKSLKEQKACEINKYNKVEKKKEQYLYL